MCSENFIWRRRRVTSLDDSLLDGDLLGDHLGRCDQRLLGVSRSRVVGHSGDRQWLDRRRRRRRRWGACDVHSVACMKPLQTSSLAPTMIFGRTVSAQWHLAHAINEAQRVRLSMSRTNSVSGTSATTVGDYWHAGSATGSGPDRQHEVGRAGDLATV